MGGYSGSMAQVRSSMQETSFALWSLVMMYIIIPLVALVLGVRRHDSGCASPSVLCDPCRPVLFVRLCPASTALGHRSSLLLAYNVLVVIG